MPASQIPNAFGEGDYVALFVVVVFESFHDHTDTDNSEAVRRGGRAYSAAFY